MNCCKCSGNGMRRSVETGLYVACNNCGATGYEPRLPWKRYVVAIVAFILFVAAYGRVLEAITS